MHSAKRRIWQPSVETSFVEKGKTIHNTIRIEGSTAFPTPAGAVVYARMERNVHENNHHAETTERTLHRLKARGSSNKQNDVLVSIAPHATCNVLFFPGDVQDFRSEMATGTFKEFSSYSYEDTVELLVAQFGHDANVWIIRPSRFQHGAFSCYDHFTTCNKYGAATSYTHQGTAIRHLVALMRFTASALGLSDVTLALPSHLVGFSKGVVVVNQLVADLASKALGESNNDKEDTDHVHLGRHFFSHVASIHWVDGGNGALRGVFPSDSAALIALSEFRRIYCSVHVTPYQYCSPERSWIRTEAHAFVDQLKQLNIRAQLIRYYEHETGVPSSSLQTHFQLLRDFDIRTCSEVNKSDLFSSSPIHPLNPVHIQGFRKRYRAETS